jgi:formimidoylglutamate deiminase
MPNVHSHAFQRVMAGLTEVAGDAADHFWSWREVMYRFVDRLEPEDVEAVSAFAFAEMLEAGYTRVAEFHYLHHAVDGAAYADIGEMATRIAAAAEISGIGLTLLPVFYAHGNFGGSPPSAGQRRFINDIERYARLLDASRRAIAPLGGARLGVAPHSLRAVSPEELAAVTALVDSAAPIHLHIAEQRKEVEDCVAWCGQPPVEWLADHVPLDARWCLVHATHVNARELTSLAASGAVAGLCPITEANLGDGVFPTRAYLDAGGRWAIGSDSNVLIDAAAELRALEYAQRLTRQRRNVLGGVPSGASTGRTLWQGALEGGLRAHAESLPALSVGAAADLVSLDVSHPALAGHRRDAALDGFVFAARESAVDCVWRAGRKLVSGGAHRVREPLRVRYRALLSRVLG